jgi:hypothetical protein
MAPFFPVGAVVSIAKFRLYRLFAFTMKENRVRPSGYEYGVARRPVQVLSRPGTTMSPAVDRLGQAGLGGQLTTDGDHVHHREDAGAPVAVAFHSFVIGEEAPDFLDRSVDPSIRR